MNSYLIVNLICMGLILFANLGVGVNFVLLGIQLGTVVLQYKNRRNYE